MDQLLTLLSADARLTNAQLAAALSISEEEVAARIADYEERKIIKGYKAIVDWDKTERDYVNARIELKVTPQKGMGFEEIAGIIARFDEVEYCPHCYRQDLQGCSHVRGAPSGAAGFGAVHFHQLCAAHL